jgi:hypothetical protein
MLARGFSRGDPISGLSEPTCKHDQAQRSPLGQTMVDAVEKVGGESRRGLAVGSIWQAQD